MSESRAVRKMPRFGARDVEIARCLTNNYTVDLGEVQEWAADIMRLLRVLVEEDGVVVRRDEIEEVRRGVLFKQMSQEYINARKILDRW